MTSRAVRLGSASLLVTGCLGCLGLPALGASDASPKPSMHPYGSKPDIALQDVTAIAADDAWAVGYDGTISRDTRGYVQHWDGRQWRSTDVPLPAHDFSLLTSVSGAARDDVWAVGLGASTAGGSLILHWDGGSWSLAGTPPKTAGLNGVSVGSADDVWAVGTGGKGTFTEHFDGTTWRHVPSPNVQRHDHNELNGVVTVDSQDAWAVGYSASGGHARTLAEHWDGTRWAMVSAVELAPRGNYLNAVDASSSNDVWAVGSGQAHLGYDYGIVERWDGQSWRTAALPKVLNTQLNSVSVQAADDVWAVGSIVTGSSPYTIEPLVWHWDGTSWSRVAAAGARGLRDAFYGVSARAADDAWAVGVAGNNSLVRHWDGTRWS